MSEQTNSTTEQFSDAVHKAGDLVVSAVKQGQGLTLDAARKATEATSSLPTFPLPVIPGADSLPDVSALATYSFDLAIELLTAQRDFAVDLAAALTPAKSA